MAEVRISESLKNEVFKKFKNDSEKIFAQMKSLEESSKKGKALGSVDGIIIKELKCGVYRFYFITDGHILKFGTELELASLIIKFVRMSDKKDQQKMIDEIKNILKSMGFEKI